MQIVPHSLFHALALVFASLAVPACSHGPDAAFSYAELKGGAVERGVKGDDRPGALYQAGSIAKYACSLAVLRLQYAGVLRLDQPIASILTGFDQRPVGSVTVRQLLANRSGVADGLMPAIRADMDAVLAVEGGREAIERFIPEDLAFDPGSRFSYDLANWIFVQEILETVSGDRLETALDELVFAPAGLSDTRVFSGRPDARMQEPVEPATPAPAWLGCAGGMVSTPSDLVALLRFAHTGGLSPESLGTLMKVVTPEENYSLGGRVETVGQRVLDWKTGSNGPYKSLAVYDPQRDIGFAAMSADGNWSAIEAARAAWIARTNED